MADVVWPTRLLVPADAHAHVAAMNTSGGAAFNSAEQIVGNTPGRVKIELGSVHLYGSRVKAWNAIAAVLNGRAGVVTMPLFDQPRAPWPTNPSTGRIWSDPSSLFDDGSGFDDGTGFIQTIIRAINIGPIPVGATSCNIQVNLGGPLHGGEWFSPPPGANGCKAYRIGKILGVDTSGNYPVYSVTFTPPCRSYIIIRQALNFDNPTVDCRLDSDDAMMIKGGLSLWRTASPNLTLNEDVTSGA